MRLYSHRSMVHLTVTNMDNVNRLNGVPNFGHGFEEVEEVIPTEPETPAIDEEDSGLETEIKHEKHGKKRKGQVHA